MGPSLPARLTPAKLPTVCVCFNVFLLFFIPTCLLVRVELSTSIQQMPLLPPAISDLLTA